MLLVGAFLLVALGWLVAAVGMVWLLIEAFKVSIWWGFGLMFVPFVGIGFLLKHWDVAKRPWRITFGGMLGVVVGIGLTIWAVSLSEGSVSLSF